MGYQEVHIIDATMETFGFHGLAAMMMLGDPRMIVGAKRGGRRGSIARAEFLRKNTDKKFGKTRLKLSENACSSDMLL